MKRWLVAVILLALSIQVRAQNTGALLPAIPPPFFTATGAIASGAKLCTTASGTSNNLETYSDAALSSALPNPITLSSGGLPQTGGGALTLVYTQAQAYRVTLYLAGTGNLCNGVPVGTQQWQYDGIYNLSQIAGTAGWSYSSPTITLSTLTDRVVIGGSAGTFATAPTYNGALIASGGIYATNGVTTNASTLAMGFDNVANMQIISGKIGSGSIMPLVLSGSSISLNIGGGGEALTLRNATPATILVVDITGGVQVLSTAGTSSSNGVLIEAGTNSSDFGLRVQPKGGGANYLDLEGDGNLFIGALKTVTGTAGGKKVVCVDTSTGKLLTSSTSTDCTN